MAKHIKRFSIMVWLRRITQTFFLLLFFNLFLKTTFYPPNNVGGPVTFFFNIDPLVLFTTWLATHAVPTALLLALITLAVTFIFGRWFCGWVCPFGVIHNLLTSMRTRKLKDRIASAAYTPTQKIKYYILIFCVLAAVAGFNAIGWLDPFSFLYRSLAVAVYPALSNGIGDIFSWMYDTEPVFLGINWLNVTEPGYDFMREHFLPIEQPYYAGSLLIGVLFIVIVLLNLYKARFWCRYICPLGALLGVVGKNPLFRFEKDLESCNQCRLCVENCQGGAEPHTLTEWKPSECFYCWNCVPACPHNSITFSFNVPKKGDSHE
ncbi:4Fe-4S binding protein [bacterium]|nr:4Fe-4S binding protein [bacterium]